MLRRLAVLALPLIGALTAAAEEAPRTISTTGEATVYVVPDQVLVNFGVESFDADLGAARARNDEASRRLVNAIRKLGIPEKQIQADHAEVEIVYRDGGPEAGIAGYRVRRAYAVTLKDVSAFEKLIDVALRNGANHLAGFEYRTTELRKHRDEARRLAIRAAREKAEALASELGCRAGEPRTIGEGYSGWFGQHGSWWGYRYGSNMMSQNVAVAGGGGGSDSETMLLGQIGVKASINVVFDLESGKAPP